MVDACFGGMHAQEQRPLLIYAVPLMKERLVFLPVAEWAEEEKKATELDPPPGAWPVSKLLL